MMPHLRVALLCAIATTVIPQWLFGDTQEVTFNNRLPVYVGDVVNEAEATVDAQHAGRLCARLNSAIKEIDDADRHNANCIFHIVRFNDVTDADQVQTVDVQHWLIYSNDHFWSLEDLQQKKRLFGEAHVSFFFIHINRASWKIKNVTVASNVLTVTVDNDFKPGQNVGLGGFKSATYLNGQHVKVLAATSTTFTATFNHADYAAASDTGAVTFSTAGSLVAQPPVETKCDELPMLPPTGADGYYASYKVDVKRKVSANVQHLFSLLAVEGLKGADQISTDPLDIDVPALLARETVTDRVANTKANKCRVPDAEFGGGALEVAYRPSDISITGSLKSGVGAHEVVVAIDKDAYVVDNEGRYYVDFSVPVTLKNLSAVQYQSTNNTFSPVDTSSLNAFLALDGFFPASDVKSQNWTRYPHPLVGVGFAKQPLHKILVAGAWGPHFSELFIGAAWVKQARIAQGSNSCKASAGSSTDSPNSFGYHYCLEFSIGINLSVTGIANKLGSPK